MHLRRLEARAVSCVWSTAASAETCTAITSHNSFQSATLLLPDFRKRRLPAHQDVDVYLVLWNRLHDFFETRRGIFRKDYLPFQQRRQVANAIKRRTDRFHPMLNSPLVELPIAQLVNAHDFGGTQLRQHGIE